MSAAQRSATDTSARPFRRLPASPSTAAGARAFVVETLRRWHVGPESVDDAEVVVSELVTNAFVHGRAAEVGITLVDRGAVVRVQVEHQEAGAGSQPALAPLTVSADETHGRGLAIVDVLSSAWGVEESGDERRVWADLVADRSGLLPAAERDAALTDLAAALAATADVRAAGRAVTDWARTRLATSFTGVALLERSDDRARVLRYLSVEPLPKPSAEAWARFPVEADAPVAAAFRHARPYFHETRSAAVAHFPDLGPALAAARLAALAHLPLLDGGHPLGTLALAWSHGRELDTADRTWLAAVAAVAAAALVRVGAGDDDDAAGSAR